MLKEIFSFLFYPKKRLNSSEAVAYIQKLNANSRKLYASLGVRGTLASEDEVDLAVQTDGELILCLIPHDCLHSVSAGNKKRVKSIEKLFDRVNNNFRKIPPIVILSFKEDYLDLADGHTRAYVAYQRGLSLLAYVPEKIVTGNPSFAKI